MGYPREELIDPVNNNTQVLTSGLLILSVCTGTNPFLHSE